MKKKIEIQYMGHNVTAADVEAAVKSDIKDKGFTMKEVDHIDMYYKPLERAIYYVAVMKDYTVTGTGNVPLRI